jgi:hypothetical protein
MNENKNKIDIDADTGAEVDSFLVYADIGGYTRFMKENRYALAHAQFAVTQLLESVLDSARASLRLAKIEGDAVFLYAADEDATERRHIQPGAVADSMFRMFRAFYAKREQLEVDNFCPCEGCRSLRLLDLKVIGHRGRVLFYNLKDRNELAGFDVIILHRLAKNSVPEPRYLMLTEAAYEALPISGDIAADRHVETYDDVGAIETRVLHVLPDPGPRPERSLWRGLKDLGAKFVIWTRIATGHNPFA